MQVAVHTVQPTYGSADSLPTRDEWRELLDAKPDVKTALTECAKKHAEWFFGGKLELLKQALLNEE